MTNYFNMIRNSRKNIFNLTQFIYYVRLIVKSRMKILKWIFIKDRLLGNSSREDEKAVFTHNPDLLKIGKSKDINDHNKIWLI